MNFRQLVETALDAHRRDDLATASRLYDRALSLRPNDAGLLGLKGIVLKQQGHLDAAAALIQRGLRLNPRDAQLHNYLALVLVDQGDQAGAETEFTAAILLEPKYTEALFNAGKLFLKRGKPSDAVHVLKRAAVLAPTDLMVQLDLALAHFYNNDLPEANTCLQRARSIGLPIEQAEVFQRAIQRGLGDEYVDPIPPNLMVTNESRGGMVDILLKVAKAESHLGNLGDASRLIEKAIELNPELPTLYVELSQVRKFKESDTPLIEKMESLSTTNTESSRRGMEFALGKVYSDIGNYGSAFAHYKLGNDLLRKIQPFDSKVHEDEVSSIISLFSKEQLASLPAGSDSNLPVLIVGTPRSGTTLTESIISAHSKISGAGELDFWPRVITPLMKDFPASYNALASQAAREYLDFLRRRSQSADYITDKLPANYLAMGVIHAVFPNAKFIHCMRHPIDACLSIYFQNFQGQHTYKYDLESLVSWYEQYQRLMAHWRSVLPQGVMYELQYEDLISDQGQESRKLMDFLGLDLEPQQLDFHQQDRTVYTASKWQVRQPLYKTSVERWRRYEKHLGPLLGLLKYARQ